MKPDKKDLERLLSRGGWELDDAQARARENPKTFKLPSPKVLAKLKPGHSVRLIFKVLDLADMVRDGLEPYSDRGVPQLVIQYERMWLWLEREQGDELVGVLMNTPASTHSRLLPGARVHFAKTDVIDLDLEPPVDMKTELKAMEELGFPLLDEKSVLKAEDPKRLPSISDAQFAICKKKKVKPQRPWAFGRALMGGSLQPDVWPVYGVRSHPRPDRGDCGWTFWTGDSDMSRAAKKSKFEIIEVQAIGERCPAVVPYLALPPGWAFVLGPDGYADVYENE
ncbi:MAG: immunity protein Imm33 domain-containing protein [Archangium sp.]